MVSVIYTYSHVFVYLLIKSLLSDIIPKSLTYVLSKSQCVESNGTRELAHAAVKGAYTFEQDMKIGNCTHT